MLSVLRAWDEGSVQSLKHYDILILDLENEYDFEFRTSNHDYERMLK